MRPISSHSQQAALSWQRRPGPRRAAGAGLSAAALIALAACGSSNANGSGGSGGTSLTPRDALVAAVSHTQKVTSAVETLNVKVSGAQSLSTTGTVQVRLKPTLLIGANLNITEAGKTTPIKEVLTGTAIYFSAPSLTGQLSSKPRAPSRPPRRSSRCPPATAVLCPRNCRRWATTPSTSTSGSTARITCGR
jgi:hypothetical protein